MVVIITILLAIAVPMYDTIEPKARDRTDEANVKILNSATLQWVLANKANDPRTISASDLKAALANYISDWPESPNGKDYVLDNGLWKVEE